MNYNAISGNASRLRHSPNSALALIEQQHFTISRHASPCRGFLFHARYGSLNSPLCSCVSITLPDSS